VSRSELEQAFLRAAAGGGAATERQQGQVKHDKAARRLMDAQFGNLQGITITRSQW
jgi:hypothetical protein